MRALRTPLARCLWILPLVVAGLEACRKGPPPAPIQIASRQAVTANHGAVGVEAIGAFERLTPAELDRLRGTKVFWGHQSVGRDLMGGARALGFAFDTVTNAADYARVTRGEALIADNRDPERKIRSFRTLFLDQQIGSAVQVAAFKFCWVDFNDDTDLDALLQHYGEAVQAAQQRYPAVRFFHVTPPLTSDEPRENRIRVQFGERLLQRYQGQAIVLNLSELQSTRADGSRCVRDNSAVLCDEYRSDEGHFNDAGAQRAAKAFLYAILRAGG